MTKIKSTYGNISIYHGDALDILSNIPKADVFFTDPPYRLTSGGVAGNHTKWGGKIKDHSIRIKKTHPPTGKIHKSKMNSGVHNNGNIVKADISWEQIINLMYNNGAENHKAYVMCNDKNLTECLYQARAVGYKVHNVLVWEKSNKVMNAHGMKNVEYIPLFFKGKAKPFKDCGFATYVKDWGGVSLKFDNPYDKEHPTVKPIGLIESILRATCYGDEIIVDPFAGAGTTAIACHKLGLECHTVELEQEYYELTCKRVNGVVDVNSIFNL